jgi:hypothetical protein
MYYCHDHVEPSSGRGQRVRAYLHDTTSRMRLLSWRMKTTADATIPVHQFMAKFEI